MDPHVRNILLSAIFTLSFSLMSIQVARVFNGPTLCQAFVGIPPLVWIPFVVDAGFDNQTAAVIGLTATGVSWYLGIWARNNAVA